MPLDHDDESWVPEDRPALREALATIRRQREQREETAKAEEVVISPALFADIVGHLGQKRIILGALESARPVHVLMVGPPGTAKTEFLLAMKPLKGSRYATGASISVAGIFQFLQQFPDTKRLLIDEIDKAKDTDLWLLLELMQSGTISRLKQDRQEQLSYPNVRVFAAANSIEKLPEPLVSRFTLLDFPAYGKAQFIHVVTTVLQQREGVSAARAKEIAEAVAERSRDPRAAVKVARLAGETGELAPILDEILPDRAPPPEPPHTVTEAVARKLKGR
jgi:holliday junction DNA helicase RuvB